MDTAQLITTFREDDLFKDVANKEIKDVLDKQGPTLLGSAINDDYFHRLGFNFSNYSGIRLAIVISNSFDVHRYTNLQCGPKNLLIDQEFLNKVFSKAKSIPQLTKLEEAKCPEDLLVVDVHIYPIISLESGVLYKLDLSIEEWKPEETPLLMNVIQKHFFTDKDGLFFRDQIERALKKCFRVMEEAFLETKDKKVFLVRRANEVWEFLDRHKKENKEEEKSSSDSKQQPAQAINNLITETKRPEGKDQLILGPNTIRSS